MIWIKFAAAFLLPPGSILLLGGIGMVLLKPMPRLGRGLVIAALVLGYALSLPVVGDSLKMALEFEQRPPAARADAGAIVALGAGAYPGAPEYRGAGIEPGTLERLRYAARLHRETGAPILVTGGDPLGLGVAEADAMKSALTSDFGVEVAWTESRSRNTLENARQSAELLKGAGIASVYLVTHASHMPRARRAFEQAGLGVVPAPTGFTTRRRPGALAWVPDAGALRDSSTALYEMLGLAWYRLIS